MEHHNLQDDIEELLKIAESSKTPVKHDNTGAEIYIRDFEIKSGETKVSTYIIYYHYWSNLKNKTKLMSRRAFFIQFKKYFERVQTSDGKGYLLDPEPYDLTVQGFFKARALLRRERNGRKKEKSK